MMVNAAKKSAEPAVHDPAKLPGRLKLIGGSMSDDWNNIVANQAVSALWLQNSDAEEIKEQRYAAVDALVGIAPRDELEGMIAAQLVACHNASMECYRRAMIGEQTFEGRRENLNQANKLSRTYATLLECAQSPPRQGPAKGHRRARPRACRRRRPSSATSRPRGVGIAPKSKDQPHAKQIAHAPGSRDAERGRRRGSRVPVAGDAERPMPDARRNVTGRTEGK